jgi:large exoprotein involved in heme utilization and adhesion
VSLLATGSIELSGLKTVVATDAFRRGAAGAVLVSAPRVTVSGGASLSSSSVPGARGDAGAITVRAGQLALAGGASIASSSAGVGRAGNIRLDLGGSLRLLGGSSISTAAERSDGGDVAVSARELVYLRDSRITTSVNQRSGHGGNITIDPTFVVLDNSQVIARAAEGAGGNIRIFSDYFISESSVVDASSQRGISGTVTISSPNVDLGSGLVVLPSGFLDASSLLRASCGARAGNSNSFMAAGRGGIAEAPAPFTSTPARLSLAGGCGSS